MTVPPTDMAKLADELWEALKRQCATTPDKSLVKTLVAVRRADIDAAVASLSLRTASPAPEPWQSIETAPKDGTCILIWEEANDDPVVGFWQAGEWLVRWDHERYTDPTHWQPLPAAPEPFVNPNHLRTCALYHDRLLQGITSACSCGGLEKDRIEAIPAPEPQRTEG